MVTQRHSSIMAKLLLAVSRRCLPAVVRPQRTLAAMSADKRFQVTDTVLMIKPSSFNYNPQTATDNSFQKHLEGLTANQIRKQALTEFYGLVSVLKSKGVSVYVEEDTLGTSEDAVFPNNWISYHHEGPKIVLYPMKAKNRRLERRTDIVTFWKDKLGADVIDYTGYEKEGKFLEGTGSLVLDRTNRIAYACKSLRTNTEVLERFCNDFSYSPVVFEASQDDGSGRLLPIYHTNVMLAIGEQFAVVCLESIQNNDERALVSQTLEKTGKEVIPVTESQVNGFAGNVLQLRGTDGKTFLVCSTQGYNSFTPEQLLVIRKHCSDIVHTPLDTIETGGGGGARCMLAEIFPPHSEV